MEKIKKKTYYHCPCIPHNQDPCPVCHKINEDKYQTKITKITMEKLGTIQPSKEKPAECEFCKKWNPEEHTERTCSCPCHKSAKEPIYTGDMEVIKETHPSPSKPFSEGEKGAECNCDFNSDKRCFHHASDCPLFLDDREIPEGEWEKEFRKMMGKALITLDVIMIRDFFRQLLAEQEQKVRMEYFSDLSGVSQWRNIGIERGYDKYFGIKFK